MVRNFIFFLLLFWPVRTLAFTDEIKNIENAIESIGTKVYWSNDNKICSQNLLGAYIPKKDIIYICQDNHQKDYNELVGTLKHEGWHAIQNKCTKNKQIVSDEKIRNALKLRDRQVLHEYHPRNQRAEAEARVVEQIVTETWIRGVATYCSDVIAEVEAINLGDKKNCLKIKEWKDKNKKLEKSLNEISRKYENSQTDELDKADGFRQYSRLSYKKESLIDSNMDNIKALLLTLGVDLETSREKIKYLKDQEYFDASYRNLTSFLASKEREHVMNNFWKVKIPEIKELCKPYTFSYVDLSFIK